ncbi:MAG: hypothetical protein WBP75_11120, partial [Candidatus Cybelea sp.]
YRRPAVADWIRENELATLPRTASIGTGGFVIAHLGMNPRATIAMSDQDYLIFDAFSDPAYWSAVDASKVKHLVKSGAYDRISDVAGIVVLVKKRRL